MQRVKSGDKRPASQKNPSQSRSRDNSARGAKISIEREGETFPSSLVVSNSIRSQLSALFHPMTGNTAPARSRIIDRNPPAKLNTTQPSKWIESGYLEQPSIIF